MNVILWANESFDYVRNTCYVFTPQDLKLKEKGILKAPYQINPSEPVPQLGTWYLDRNLPVIFQRLTAASVRLAKLLNEIFGKNKDKNFLIELEKFINQNLN